MTKVKTDFYCNICDKYYKSINSLCNHKKKFHSENNAKITTYNHFDNPNITKNGYKKVNNYSV